jgi:peptide chain release factor subunit 1
LAEQDRSLLRSLAEWDAGDVPVTSVYLAVDGRLRPRRQDHELALSSLLKRVRDQAEEATKEARASLEGDVTAMEEFVRDRFDRGPTRGLAMFSASAAGLWQEVRIPRPVRDRVSVASHPDLAALQALFEVYQPMCTVLVDSTKARIFVVDFGSIEEQTDLLDEVPGRHQQGGWSQARYERHVEDHRQRHLRHTAEVLFRFHKRRGFDNLVLAGPEEAVAALEAELHDYLKRIIRGRLNTQVGASSDEVLASSLEVAEELEGQRERETIERLEAESGAGRLATSGLEPTLAAVADGRAGTLVVAHDLAAPGYECPQCGRLSTQGGKCRACGAKLGPVPDVVEAAVAQAFRSGCAVEVVTRDGALERVPGIGALLRF